MGSLNFLRGDEPLSLDGDLGEDEIARVVVFVRPGQGKNALTYKVSEALNRAGFHVIFKDTDCVGMMPNPSYEKVLQSLKERTGFIQVGGMPARTATK